MQLRAGRRSCAARQGRARPTVAALEAPKRGKGAASFSSPPLLRRGQALKCVIRPDQAAIREFPGAQPEITAFTGKRGAQALRLEVQQLGKLFGCNTHFDELQSIRVGGMGWISTKWGNLSKCGADCGNSGALLQTLAPHLVRVDHSSERGGGFPIAPF